MNFANFDFRSENLQENFNRGNNGSVFKQNEAVMVIMHVLGQGRIKILSPLVHTLTLSIEYLCYNNPFSQLLAFYQYRRFRNVTQPLKFENWYFSNSRSLS